MNRVLWGRLDFPFGPPPFPDGTRQNRNCPNNEVKTNRSRVFVVFAVQL